MHPGAEVNRIILLRSVVQTKPGPGLELTRPAIDRHLGVGMVGGGPLARRGRVRTVRTGVSKPAEAIC